MVDVRHVLNIPDELLTPLTTEGPMEGSDPTLYSSLIWQSKFHLIANSISNRLLSQPQISAGDALRSKDVIELWKDGLPDFFNINIEPKVTFDWYLFARSKLWWRFWNLKILITRPFLLRWTVRQRTTEPSRAEVEESECRRVCIDSARLTISSIQDYVLKNSLTRLSSWYALYFLFHAALVPLVCLRTDPQSPDAVSWKEDVSTAKFLLQVIFTDYSLARRCLDVLGQLAPQPWTEGDGSYSQNPEETGPQDSTFWASDPFLGWPEFVEEFQESSFIME